jgi:hypothetical protein
MSTRQGLIDRLLASRALAGGMAFSGTIPTGKVAHSTASNPSAGGRPIFEQTWDEKLMAREARQQGAALSPYTRKAPQPVISYGTLPPPPPPSPPPSQTMGLSPAQLEELDGLLAQQLVPPAAGESVPVLTCLRQNLMNRSGPGRTVRERLVERAALRSRVGKTG